MQVEIKEQKEDMTKGQRITVFLVTLVLLGVVYWNFRNPIDAVGDRAVVIFSALVMLSFTTLLAEHYFTRPTDVVASTISVLLLISPIHRLLSDTGLWYWLLWSYSASFLLLSILSLLLLDKTRAPNSPTNRISRVLYKISTTFGSGRVV